MKQAWSRCGPIHHRPTIINLPCKVVRQSVRSPSAAKPLATLPSLPVSVLLRAAQAELWPCFQTVATKQPSVLPAPHCPACHKQQLATAWGIPQIHWVWGDDSASAMFVMKHQSHIKGQMWPDVVVCTCNHSSPGEVEVGRTLGLAALVELVSSSERLCF